MLTYFSVTLVGKFFESSPTSRIIKLASTWRHGLGSKVIILVSSGKSFEQKIQIQLESMKREYQRSLG